MEYKRLTRRNTDGTTWVKCANCDIQDKCDFTKETCCQELQDRLAELEDKIERGTLMELACKKGDKVYQVDCVRVYELTVLSIRVFHNKFYYETQGVGFDNTAIGESIFLTREEAENRLKEMEAIYGKTDKA